MPMGQNKQLLVHKDVIISLSLFKHVFWVLKRTLIETVLLSTHNNEHRFWF